MPRWEWPDGMSFMSCLVFRDTPQGEDYWEVRSHDHGQSTHEDFIFLNECLDWAEENLR